MLRSSLVRTLTDKSQLAPDSACCCAAANGESTSSTKTHASARTIFPPLCSFVCTCEFPAVSNSTATNQLQALFPLFPQRVAARYCNRLPRTIVAPNRTHFNVPTSRAALFAFLSVVADLQIGSLFLSLL